MFIGRMVLLQKLNHPGFFVLCGNIADTHLGCPGQIKENGPSIEHDFSW